MRINDTKGIDKYLKVQNKSSVKTKKTDSIKKTTNIDISDVGKEIARKVKESENEGFSSRVEEIRKSVLSGTYEVSSKDIANKIVDKMITQKASDE